MADKSKIRIKVEADVGNINKGVGQLNAKVNNFTAKAEKGFQGVTASLSKFGLAMTGLQQGFQILNRLVIPVQGFQKAMAEVNTLLDVSDAQFKTLNASVVQMSKDVGESADSLASGLYQVVSAGVDAGDSIEFLGIASRGAVAGVTDTKTAVDGISTIINAYGLESSEAERVSDLLFTTIKRGKTTFAELSQNLGQVVPVASTMGVKFEEVASSLATLTKSGLNTAMASTSLSGAITEMANPTSKASKLFKELTGETAKTSLDTEGLIGTIERLGQASEENLISSFGREGARAILILTGNIQVAKNDLDAMSNSLGATDLAFQKMTKTFDFQANQLRSNWNAVLIEAGTKILPAINLAMKGFVSLLDDFGKIVLSVTATYITYNAIMLTSNTTMLTAVKGLKLYKLAMLMVNRGIWRTINSVRALKVALVSSGVGALVLGLGFLIEYLMDSSESTESLNDDLEITTEKVSNLNKEIKKMRPMTDVNAVKLQINALETQIAVNEKLFDVTGVNEYDKTQKKIVDNLAQQKTLSSILSKENQEKDKNLIRLGEELADLLVKQSKLEVGKVGISKEQHESDKKQLAILKERKKLLESSGNTSKEEIVLQQRLASIIAKRSGQELEHLKGLVREMGKYSDLTTEQQIKYQQFMASIERMESSAKEKTADRFEREFELGLKSEIAFIQHLEKKKQGLKEMDITTEERALREKEIGDQQLQLAMARFGALRGGFKSFLKQELIDFITAQQLKLLGRLAEIMATGGATLGASLAVSLPLYGTGLALLEKAKGKVQAFAKGGLVESATLGLVGEAGPEIVAPQKDFQHYIKNDLTPMIKQNLGIDVSGKVSGYEQGLGQKLDKLIDLQKSPRTIIRGDDIVQINDNNSRGRF
tara:strand:+ start:24 stop:2678 length:2655 start_codon:yes stop_codon:yes gene_type:complete